MESNKVFDAAQASVRKNYHKEQLEKEFPDCICGTNHWNTYGMCIECGQTIAGAKSYHEQELKKLCQDCELDKNLMVETPTCETHYPKCARCEIPILASFVKNSVFCFQCEIFIRNEDSKAVNRAILKAIIEQCGEIIISKNTHCKVPTLILPANFFIPTKKDSE